LSRIRELRERDTEELHLRCKDREDGKSQIFPLQFHKNSKKGDPNEDPKWQILKYSKFLIGRNLIERKRKKKSHQKT
jgi:hypothetical protein